MFRNKIIGSSILAFFGFTYLYYMIGYPAYLCSFDRACLFNFWKDWQTLNASIIAFASAYLLFSVRTSIETKRRKNKAKAARAFLSHQLSNLLEVCDENIQALLVQKEHFEAPGHEGILQQDRAPYYCFTSFGEGHFPFFKECIELDTFEFGHELTELLQWMQIHNARHQQLHAALNRGSTQIIGKLNVYSRLMDAICLVVRLNALFNYARGIDEHFSPTGVSIAGAVSAMFDISPHSLEKGTQFFSYAESYLDRKKYRLKDETRGS